MKAALDWRGLGWRAVLAAVCVLHWLTRHSAEALHFCADGLEILRRRLQTPSRVR